MISKLYRLTTTLNRWGRSYVTVVACLIPRNVVDDAYPSAEGYIIQSGMTDNSHVGIEDRNVLAQKKSPEPIAILLRPASMPVQCRLDSVYLQKSL